MAQDIEQPRNDKGFWLSPYDEQQMLGIAERVASGELLTHICEEPGMPTRVAVWRWAQRNPEVSKAMAEARTISAHMLEERALEVAEKLLDQKNPIAKEQIRALDVAMTQLRWSAGKRNPQAYSDKTPNTPAIAIQINTTLWSEDADNMEPAEFKVVANIPAEED